MVHGGNTLGVAKSCWKKQDDLGVSVYQGSLFQGNSVIPQAVKGAPMKGDLPSVSSGLGPT